MSPYQREFWVEAWAILAAIFAIPFYMGVVHLGIIEVFAYVAVGAIAMTAGQAVRDGEFRLPLHQLLNDIGLWFVLIATCGVAAYLIALVLI